MNNSCFLDSKSASYLFFDLSKSIPFKPFLFRELQLLNVDLISFENYSALVIILLLYGQFVYRTNKLQRSLPFFPTVLFILLLITICVIVGSILSNEYGEVPPSLLALQLSLSGLGILVLYLFQENLIQTSKSDFRFIIVFGFILIHIVFQWLLVYLNGSETEITKILTTISNLCYHGAGIFVFGIFGLPIWIKTYHNTKSKMFLPYIGGYICLIVGQSILFTIELIRFFSPELIVYWLFVESFAVAIAYFGLFILNFLIAVFFPVVYRLPQENYGLMIADKYGIVLYFTRFKTSHPIELQEDLLSGFLSAIHSMFDETLKSKKKVNLMSSGDAEILMEHGEYVSVIFLAQRISGLVAGEMRRFVKDFEHKFQNELTTRQMNLVPFKRARELVEKRFPYFEIL